MESKRMWRFTRSSNYSLSWSDRSLHFLLNRVGCKQVTGLLMVLRVPDDNWILHEWLLSLLFESNTQTVLELAELPKPLR